MKKFKMFMLLTLFNCSISYSTDSVRLLSWWDEPLYDYMFSTIKHSCDVDLAYQGYVESNQFISLLESGKHWDIVVFEGTLFNMVKKNLSRDDIDINTDLKAKYPEFIRRELRENLGDSLKYSNLTFFTINNLVILYDPKVLNISKDTDIKSIINQLDKANKDLVLLDDANIISSIMEAEGYELSLRDFSELFNYKKILIQNYIDNYEDIGAMLIWSAFALEYLNKVKNKGIELKIAEIPKYQFTTANYIGQLSKDENTKCVVDVLTSEDFFLRSKTTFDFTPYVNYESISDEEFYNLYRRFYMQGSEYKLKWIDNKKNSENIYNAWNKILVQKGI
ncbi:MULTISPECIES: hypothetical protein [Francisella]|uniref:hypothetical protein n=1 Tax=Francisella TaxID=262 RepID=UPI0011B5A344|nr:MULTISPECIES: hypothetical protein [Francisella]